MYLEGSRYAPRNSLLPAIKNIVHQNHSIVFPLSFFQKVFSRGQPSPNKTLHVDCCFCIQASV